MNQKFNNNELIIISKYINHNDYHTFFKLFSNLNQLYKSTFNYINLKNIYSINFVQLKNKYSLNLFPNVEVVNINIDFNDFDCYECDFLVLIIKVYNIFSKLYSNKFIKLNIATKYLCILFDDKVFKYLDKIDKLIENNNINNDFKIYINNDFYSDKLDKYNFIKYVKFIKYYEEIDFPKLKDNQVYDIYSNFITKNRSIIKNENDLNKIYFHTYKNTIFKKLDGKVCVINANNMKYYYLFNVIDFPLYYELMKLGIKLSCNKGEHNYTNEYKNKLNLYDNYEYLFDYLFGLHPLKKDVTKVIYNITKMENINVYDYYNVVDRLSKIFKNDE